MMSHFKRIGVITGWLLLIARHLFGDVPAGYQQYLVSGEEVQMWNILAEPPENTHVLPIDFKTVEKAFFRVLLEQQRD